MENYNISPIDYCINNLIKYDFDQIIIGVNNLNHLNEIINFKNIKNFKKLNQFKIYDLKLIDPRKWR